MKTKYSGLEEQGLYPSQQARAGRQLHEVTVSHRLATWLCPPPHVASISDSKRTAVLFSSQQERGRRKSPGKEIYLYIDDPEFANITPVHIPLVPSHMVTHNPKGDTVLNYLVRWQCTQLTGPGRVAVSNKRRGLWSWGTSWQSLLCHVCTEFVLCLRLSLWVRQWPAFQKARDSQIQQ